MSAACPECQPGKGKKGSAINFLAILTTFHSTVDTFDHITIAQILMVTGTITDDLVHQVRDWYSGVAIKMGRRQGATREHI